MLIGVRFRNALLKNKCPDWNASGCGKKVGKPSNVAELRPPAKLVVAGLTQPSCQSGKVDTAFWVLWSWKRG